MRVDTYVVRLYIAGSLETAKDVIRKTCYQEAICVTIEPTTFIYTGGEESGVVVGFVNYPRAPSKPEDLLQRARMLADLLMPTLNQKSALLVASDRTEWITKDPPGAARTA